MHEEALRAALSDLPSGAEGHVLLHMYAVIAGIVEQVRTVSPPSENPGVFAFLDGYDVALRAYEQPGLIGADRYAWWNERRVEWEATAQTHLPLRAMIHRSGLDPETLPVLIVAGLVEEDIRFGALFAACQQPLAARRPCLGVLGWLLGHGPGEPANVWPACRALLDDGFLTVENATEPRSEWVVRVPTAIWDALRGRMSDHPTPGLARFPARSFPELDDLILSDSLRAQLTHMPELLRSGQVGALVLRGMSGAGRRTVLGSVARSLGCDVLFGEAANPGDEGWRLLGPLSTLEGALPVLRLDPGPGETIDLPLLPGYRGPVGITLGRSGGLRGPLMEHALSLTIPAPGVEARRQFWAATGMPLAPALEEEIAQRFLLTGGNIHRAAGLARTYASLESRAAATTLDIQRASRALSRQVLETLATPIETMDGWGDLVAGPATTRELQALEARCRRREVLRRQAGPALSQDLNRGVRALFSGPSGTGKTLAARALSGALQMDLYRVDLAAVVNKYIGETERNLNQVLSRAEELDVVLLLDEGDALMASRTEVRNANDRYANLETNYLLQRLETFDGIVIVTTNAGSRIDAAFLRRLDVVIDFAPPDAAERWLIWQSHLPPTSAVRADFLEEVATRCVLTGGQIRNAALHATLLAIADREEVGDIHLEAAVQREFRKAGASYPMRNTLPAAPQMDRLRQFAAELG